jgi:RimJ/RimL family protein N-acetyltransferase
LKEYWGKGLAAEASLLLIEWAKRNLSLKQIYLIVNPDHKTAIDLYTKLGFLAVSDDIKMILEL